MTVPKVTTLRMRTIWAATILVPGDLGSSDHQVIWEREWAAKIK